MQGDAHRKIEAITHLIGNTPLLEIHFRYKGKERKIYAKAEYYNLTGSIKDRMAFHILAKAQERGVLAEHVTIVEATSGNTGIAFSAIGRALGYDVVIFMPDWMSEERKCLIRSYGARLVFVSKEDGGFLGSIARANEYAAGLKGSFLPKQFSNEDNSEAHYLTTGPEIWAQLAGIGVTPDAFVAGVGTGGTVMGNGRYLKEKNPKIKIHPLEPANSPTMSTGHKVGKHRIQGISDEFIPDLVKLDRLDDIVQVDDGDSIIMVQKFARDLGLGLGISSGANFIGAIKAQDALGPGAEVVTVFSDDSKKYLSTDFIREEPVKDGFYSTQVELLGVNSIRRDCRICGGPSGAG
jgi:cysteine synthase A